MNKTDEKAAERILTRAVQQAIARLGATRHASGRDDLDRKVFEINRHNFEIAIGAADMLLVES